MKPIRLLYLSSILIMPLLTASCAGYRVGAVTPDYLTEVSTINIPNFKNNTLEPRLDAIVTNAVIARFMNDGTLQVTNGDNADTVLEGTITRVDRRQLRSARFNTLRSRELGFIITVDYRLIEPATQRVLAAGTVRGDTSLFVDANIQGAERQAVPDAALRLAENLVTRVTEGGAW